MSIQLSWVANKTCVIIIYTRANIIVSDKLTIAVYARAHVCMCTRVCVYVLCVRMYVSMCVRVWHKYITEWHLIVRACFLRVFVWMYRV